MENKMLGWSLMVLGLVLMVLNPCPANGITCQEAKLTLSPCQLAFLVGPGLAEPGPLCCLGVRSVVSQATTTEIRRDLCRCLKQTLSGMKVDLHKLKLIPQYCKVSLPVPLDPRVNCSTVPMV